MDTDTILIFIVAITGCCLITGSIICLISAIKVYKEIKNKQIENEKMKLLAGLDPKSANTEIEEWIKEYINEYAVKNFLAQSIDYIAKDDIDEMIRKLTRECTLHIPELYIFYAKCIVSIKTTDDLVAFLYKKVSNMVLDFATNFNKAK